MWTSVLAALLPAVAARSVLHPRQVEGGGIGNGPVRDDAYSYQPLEPYYAATPHACPQIEPGQIDLDELLGPWHLSLLLLADRTPTSDGLEEPLLDESMCAEVELVRTNASMLRLDWQLRQLALPAGLSDLHLQVSAAVLGQPGLWGLATPLGGEMVGTVSHASPRSHFVLTVCGENQAPRQGADGDLAIHVLTAVLTRRAPSALGSLELLRLSGLMAPVNGYRRIDERLLSWGRC